MLCAPGHISRRRASTAGAATATATGAANDCDADVVPALAEFKPTGLLLVPRPRVKVVLCFAENGGSAEPLLASTGISRKLCRQEGHVHGGPAEGRSPAPDPASDVEAAPTFGAAAP